MSTPKSTQPGDAAAKHVSFTPAHAEAGGSGLPTGQSADDNSRQQSTQGSARQQPEGKADQSNEGRTGGLEAQAKSWINQQQWLQNIDVNQLSKQAKDLGSKAVEQVNRLTPTQKVVGGALLVSGLSWLALRSKSSKAYGSSTSANGEDDTWQRSSESIYRGHMKDEA